MLIRQATPQDAHAFGQLLCQLDRETRFMLFEPGERAIDDDAQAERFERMRQSPWPQVVFLAEGEGRLAGFLGATAGSQRRSRFTASLVVGVLSEYAGRGIGSALLNACETWARDRDVRRLELTVMTHNARALALYRSRGFVVEGTRRQALLVDGAFVDEHYMGKILEVDGDVQRS
jgi:RimJ/RimL family protein N-acetyltransferase